MTYPLRFLFSVFPVVWCGLAQDPSPAPEVAGRVLEAGTLRPVPEARVVLTKAPSGATGFVAPKDALANTVTDSEGSFRLQPEFGVYRLEVSKEGWQPADQPLAAAPGNVLTFTLDKDHPSKTARFLLVRAAQVSGTILDRETEQPVQGEMVFAWRPLYREGKRFPAIAGLQSTSQDGRFRFSQLPPGDYLFQIAPRTRGGQRLREHFSPEELGKVGSEFETVYWPGGFDLDSAVPLSIASGSSLDLGSLRIERVPVYPVRAVVAGNCAPDRRVQIGVRPETESVQSTLGEVACGADFLITGFVPGAYRLVATLQGPDGRLSGSTPLVISDQTAEVKLSLDRGVDLDARFVSASSARLPDFHGISVRLTTIPGGTAPSASAPADGDGKLQLKGIDLSDYRIHISGLKGLYCVKSMRYNGAAIGDNTLRLNANSPRHALEIELSDRPSGIVGRVVDGDKQVGQPQVVLAPWPVSGDLYASIFRTSGDEQGNFQFAGLAAGEYRAFAVTPENRDRLEEPGVLRGLLTNAAGIQVGEGGVGQTTLQLTALKR